MVSIDQWQASKNDSGIISLKSPTGAVREFTRIQGAVVWGDPMETDPILAVPAAILAGEQTDGILNVLREFVGTFEETTQKLVEWKDRFWVDAFYVPPEPIGMLTRLYDVDGLTQYKVERKNRLGFLVYQESSPNNQWPYFRGWDHKVFLVQFFEDFLEDFEAARLHTMELITQKKVAVQYRFLPEFETAQGQEISDAINRPVFRAFVASIWHLWQTSQYRLPNISLLPSRPKSWPWGEPDLR